MGGRSAVGDALGASAAAALTSSARFDAFVDGGGAWEEEAMLEPLRRQLEDCDACQGVVVLADVDAGWGGLARAYLAAAGDAFLPAGAARLVCGVLDGHGGSAGADEGAHGLGAGADQSARARRAMRDVNMALALTAFAGDGGGGGGVLDSCTFVPLGGVGGGSAAEQAAALSALLSAGRGRLLAAAAAAVPRAAGGEPWDTRLEEAHGAPVVALSPSVDLAGVLAFLSSTSNLRLATLRMALPLPARTATALAAWLPPPRAGLDALLPLRSWPAMRAPADSGDGDASAGALPAPPLAHLAVLRGAPAMSSCDAYGRALDAWLEAAGCPAAAHRVEPATLTTRLCPNEGAAAPAAAPAALLLHASVGADAAALLRHCGQALVAPDRSVMHRFGGDVALGDLRDAVATLLDRCS